MNIAVFGKTSDDQREPYGECMSALRLILEGATLGEVDGKGTEIIFSPYVFRPDLEIPAKNLSRYCKREHVLYLAQEIPFEQWCLSTSEDKLELAVTAFRQAIDAAKPSVISDQVKSDIKAALDVAVEIYRSGKSP